MMMRFVQQSLRRRTGRAGLLAVLFALCFVLAGCGGGGKGGDYVAPAAPALETPRLSGTVTDASGQALSGATVGFYGSAATTTTDTTGAFSFDTPPDGSQLLTVSLIGYQSQTISVYVPQGASTVSVTLQAAGTLTGSVSVSSSPAGATITLDGAASASTTDTTLAGLTPGPHTIVLSMTGMQSHTYEFNILSGQTVTLPLHTFVSDFAADADATAIKANTAALLQAYINEDKTTYLSYVDAYYSSQSLASKDELAARLDNNFASYDSLQFDMDITQIGYFTDGFYWYGEVYGYQTYSMTLPFATAPSGQAVYSARDFVYMVWVYDPVAAGWYLIWEQSGDGAYLMTTDQMTIGTTQAVFVNTKTTLADSSVAQLPTSASLTTGDGQAVTLTTAPDNTSLLGSFVGEMTPGTSSVSLQLVDRNGVSWHINAPIRYTAMQAAPDAAVVFGTNGILDGQFRNPIGVDTDSSGNIYVLDGDNHRVEVFDSGGVFLRSWGGVEGLGDSALKDPSFLKIDARDRVYISDIAASKVKVFDTGGNLVRTIGEPGAGTGQFNGPAGMFIDDTNSRLYVCDTTNNRVQAFDLTGNYVATYSADALEVPWDVVVTSAGVMHVVPYGEFGTVKFDVATGTSTGVWGSNFQRNALDGFSAILSLAIDSSDNLYVYDWEDGGESYVKKFDSNGLLLTVFGGAGTAPGQFTSTGYLAVAANGDIIVTDTYNSRVQIFR